MQRGSVSLEGRQHGWSKPHLLVVELLCRDVGSGHGVGAGVQQALDVGLGRAGVGQLEHSEHRHLRTVPDLAACEHMIAECRA